MSDYSRSAKGKNGIGHLNIIILKGWQKVVRRLPAFFLAGGETGYVKCQYFASFNLDVTFHRFNQLAGDEAETGHVYENRYQLNM